MDDRARQSVVEPGPGMKVDSATPQAAKTLVLDAGELVPTRLAETVRARLAAAIADGRLKPGDAMPSEGNIAASFGVSKQIAREAIRELAAMGMVHVQQGKVSRVRAIDGAPLGRFFRLAVGDGVEGLAQAVELRRILEPGIAALAAQRRSDADIAALRAILERMRAATGDPARWIEADLDFHRTIARISGNRLIALQLEALEPVIRGMMERFSRRNRRTSDDWHRTWLRHERVARAIEKGIGVGGARRAAAAMDAHFEGAPNALIEVRESERPARS
jgi:GntR family transcriptional repressor for pyruvate dehydrogenase complex